jgi:hypothetical protein
LPDISGKRIEKPRRCRGAGKAKEDKDMPRTSRMIIADEKAVYHVMSRTALDGFPLEDVETPVK